MTFGSLFAGIGGFDLGLERAGMECRWQVEIDDYASRVLAKHWPNVTRWGDVRTFPPSGPDEWRVDVICAGVPCQPVSHAGKQKGSDDERWMWGEALRVVADLQPAFFVAENPIGILNHDRGRTFRGLLRALASVGYVCEWHVVAASDVGAPHRRQRVWLVAYADSVSCTAGQSRRADRDVPATSAGSQGRQDQGQARTVARDCGKDVAHTDRRGCKVERLAEHGDEQGPAGHLVDRRGAWGWRARQALANAYGTRPQGSVLEHASERLPRPCSGTRRNEEQDVPEAPAGWWQAEPDVGRVAHGVPSRVDRLRCLGNAVVPQIVELIGRAIIEHQRHVAADL